MVTKVLANKKITIRKFSKKDVNRAREFQRNINSLVEEDAKILVNKKKSLKEEKIFLGDILKEIKKRKSVSLVAECEGKIVGLATIDLLKERQEHMGDFGISIIKGYRGIGLGKQMMIEVLKLAKKELKPKPKIIRLSVFKNNIPAIALYKKMGFKEVAEVPKQLQWKGKLISEIIMLLYLK